MRFGRRVKNRPRTENITRVDFTAGTVASEERHALLQGVAVRSPAAPSGGVEIHDDALSDATQDLLAALGRFQHQIVEAESGADRWSDEAMNELIGSVEIALVEDWSEVVEALTETGRILQTYEDAGRPEDCLDFLRDAYQILCLMAGDLMIGDVRPAVRDKWRSRHAAILALIEEEGLELVEDNEETSGEAPRDSEMPFALPETEAAAPRRSEDDLPTLDALPPLESLRLDLSAVPAAPPPPAVRESIDTAPVQRTVATQPARTPSSAPQPPMTPQSPTVFASFGDVGYLDGMDEEAGAAVDQAPPVSRLVLDVLDGISDQLSRIAGAAERDRTLMADRIRGGIKVLRREAKSADREALVVCALMEALLSAMPAGGAGMDRWVDAGFEFCGLYMEAAEHGETAEVAAWKEAVGEILQPRHEPAPEPQPIAGHEAECAVDTEVGESPVAASNTACEIATAGPADVREDAAEAIEAFTAAFTETSEPPAPIEDAKPKPLVEEAPMASAQPVSVAVTRTERELDSRALLESAQREALNGNGAEAKRLALLAAASIAREEEMRTERRLRETESQLKHSIDSTETARRGVAEAESAVRAAAEEVSRKEHELGQARDLSSLSVQELEEIREQAALLEQQIRELQARRDEELAKAAKAEQALEKAKLEEQARHRALGEAKLAEDARRRDLEVRRQRVKDQQRVTAEAEEQLREARAALEQQRRSLADIEQTIEHIYGAAAPAAEQSLF